MTAREAALDVIGQLSTDDGVDIVANPKSWVEGIGQWDCWGDDGIYSGLTAEAIVSEVVLELDAQAE